ncbi:MAG: ABC transporter ATP-binding protein [Sphingobacteriales bacterium]|nr:MAG: ABC transporter ATP-binding protein [Sphingobacteriales bacterium]
MEAAKENTYIETQKNASAAGDENIIVIKDLRKNFSGKDVLKDVDLEIKKGENVVVLGKSGSGKSVLIKCIVGLIQPDDGEIIVFGKDVAHLKTGELNEVRVKIGFLFQNAALYDSMTVRENLEFPLKRHNKGLKRAEIDKLVEEALADVSLSEAIDKMPSELSGGMRKRAGLARTLILKPDIMLYDEPTTGLDTGTSKGISELILEMQKKNNITSIIITHDMPCAKMTADRVVMLKEGEIIAQGTYEEMEKSDDEWIRTFFEYL